MRCEPCFRNSRPDRDEEPFIPMAPPEIGRTYDAPPACYPWNDEEFRRAVKHAVIRAKANELRMGVIVRDRKLGLTAAKDPRDVKPKAAIATVGRQGAGFIVYLSAAIADQYLIPEEWYGR